MIIVFNNHTTKDDKLISSCKKMNDFDSTCAESIDLMRKQLKLAIKDINWD